MRKAVLLGCALLLAAWGTLPVFAQDAPADAPAAELTPVEPAAEAAPAAAAPAEADAAAAPSGPQDVWWGNRSVSHGNYIRFENDCKGICERCDENMICCDTGCPCESCGHVCDDCDNCPPMVFDKIFFDLDKSVLRPEGIEECEKIVAFLNANPDKHILIEGHCCDLATTEYNVGLGQRRAASVRGYLESRGVAADRIGTRTFGESQPWVGVDQRPLNRRAVVVVAP